MLACAMIHLCTHDPKCTIPNSPKFSQEMNFNYPIIGSPWHSLGIGLAHGLALACLGSTWHGIALAAHAMAVACLGSPWHNRGMALPWLPMAWPWQSHNQQPAAVALSARLSPTTNFLWHTALPS